MPYAAFHLRHAPRRPILALAGRQSRRRRQAGDRIFVHGAAATPTALLDALAARQDVEGIRLYHLHLLGPCRFAEPEPAGRFTSVSLFTRPALRAAVEEGRADFVPIFAALDRLAVEPRHRNRGLSVGDHRTTVRRDDGRHVLLITGTPGVGKTTVIRRVADRLDATGLRGFYTEEIRTGGERCGFRLVSFDTIACVIAHVAYPKRPRVGRYGVDVRALDDAAALLRPDPDARVYLVDEIGKMECFSEQLVAAMRILLSGRTPVVATVGARGGGFIAEAKRTPGCELWEVTRANRDALPGRILAWLAA